MAAKFVGIDPDTDRDHCPTVWADEEAQEILLQGWKPTPETQAECEGTSGLRASIGVHPLGALRHPRQRRSR
ncbi:hypothetical protein [Streptomyces venezuelae]|uniref:hypothetical protein n=1 Tax=Streptomyces venezuelae TaxID=54571 RepID=UPI0036582A3E